MNRTSRIERGQIVKRIGGRLHPLSDFYHTIMQANWPTTFAIILAALVVVNLLYAIVYMLLGSGNIEGVRAGNFEDCFFFSVETLATIGYGKMVPVSRAAHIVVMLEAFTGILVTAVVTGILFAKFSRPTARVLFSNVCVISNYEGKPTLMFRIANERANRIVQASVKISALRYVKTSEGHVHRRLIDLKLHRSDSAMFAITWTVFHTVDETSPFFGATPKSLKDEQFGLVATMVGLDETLAQTVHARFSWDPDSIVFDRRFVDVLVDNDDGTRVMDLRKFHDTLPM